MVAIKITASTIESGRLSHTVVSVLVSNFVRSPDFSDLRPNGDLVNLSVEAFIRFTHPLRLAAHYRNLSIGVPNARFLRFGADIRYLILDPG